MLEIFRKCGNILCQTAVHISEQGKLSVERGVITIGVDQHGTFSTIVGTSWIGHGLSRRTTNRRILRTYAGIPATRRGEWESFRRRCHCGSANKRNENKLANRRKETKCASLRTKYRPLGGFSIRAATDAHAMRARRKGKELRGQKRAYAELAQRRTRVGLGEWEKTKRKCRTKASRSKENNRANTKAGEKTNPKN